MSEQRVVVVHQAGSATEAVVVRGLLESAGIASPGPTSTDPLPMRQPPEGFRDTDIVVLESQAEDARRVIADYVASGESIEIEESEPAEPEDTSKG
jgi:hypothetical protein